MKSKSSVARIVWSLAYLCLVALVVRMAISSHPLLVSATSQQDDRKSVEQAFSSNPQVRVTEMKIGTSVRKFNEEFDESDDWLKKLALEVENIATKPIIHLQINLNFPETKASGNLMSYAIVFGTRPNFRTSVPVKALRLMPGEKLQITLNEQYDNLERFIRTRHSVNQIHKAQVEIGFIIFEDGTAWTAGDFLRPDPNNPKRYINVGHTIPS